MTLAELLADRKVRTALIVDDACDPIPTAADMRSAGGEWVIFNDDLEGHHRALRANKSETFDCLKFTLEGSGERSDGNARTSAHALACRA